MYCLDMRTAQDTRPKEEYDVSHLSGAIQVDPHQEHSLDSLGVNADIIITGNMVHYIMVF